MRRSAIETLHVVRSSFIATERITYLQAWFSTLSTFYAMADTAAFSIYAFVYALAWFVVGFVGMELFSYLFHKYVMHGLLWSIHKTHHVKSKGFFELNDVFSLSFGIIATALVIVGAEHYDWRFWVGCGIMLYGAVYFVVHDVFIHRRIRWIERSNSRYLQALQRAHKAHHKYTERSPGEEYGLLWISRRYWKADASPDNQ